MSPKRHFIGTFSLSGGELIICVSLLVIPVYLLSLVPYKLPSADLPTAACTEK